MGKKHLQLRQIDWNDFYDPENVITNHVYADAKINFLPDGIFSEKIFGKMESDNVQYSCKCGERIGKFFEGTSCKECGTEVIFTGPVVQRAGWIDFGGNYLIKPLIYKMIDQSIFPRNVLKRVISYEVKLNLEGEIVSDEEFEEYKKSDPRFKYFNVGLEYFKDNFKEILDYYYEISNIQRKKEAYKYVMENIDHVFIDKMYVVTTIVRPALNIGGRLKFAEINNHYNSLIYNMQAIKQYTDSELMDINKLPLLYNSQIAANQVYASLGESIKGKSGFIRNNILGTRLDYSARNVITPLPPGYSINECVLPYKTLMELLRPRIINVLVQLKGINHVKANNIWRKGLLTFDSLCHKIIKELLDKTKGGVRILLNRNPTLAYGSILRLKVVDVKEDITDLTTSINNGILSSMNGDYDGDTLNIIMLNSRDLVESFKLLDPVYMNISSESGKFNRDLNVVRDQALAWANFND